MTSTAAAILTRATWRDLTAAYRLAKRYSPALAAAILAESHRRLAAIYKAERAAAKSATNGADYCTHAARAHRALVCMANWHNCTADEAAAMIHRNYSTPHPWGLKAATMGG